MSKAPKQPNIECSGPSLNADVTDLLDAMVVRGGLDLNTVKKERPLGLEKKDISWSYWCSDGRAVELATYWIQEGDEFRQYLVLEAALTKLTAHNGHSIMEFLLSKSRSFPSIFKLGLADDVAVLTVRCPVNGLSHRYVREVVEGFDGFGATLLAEIRSHFGSMSLLECFRAEDEVSKIH
ncbi:MAG: hypothetical protein HC888_06335 [Candidatus Competibacteraceae bacterium]|nr:hypothetical protein [Candidatus Competibacteraceae bacterium]